MVDREDLSFAELKPEQLNKVKRLEQELQSALHERVILLAYEEKDGDEGSPSQLPAGDVGVFTGTHDFQAIRVVSPSHYPLQRPLHLILINRRKHTSSDNL